MGNTFTETVRAFCAYQKAKEAAIQEIVKGLQESEAYQFGYWKIAVESLSNGLVRISAEDTTTGIILEVTDDEQFAWDTIIDNIML